MIENLLSYEFVITCKIKGEEYAITFTEKSNCDSVDLSERIKEAFIKLERKVDVQFGS